MTATTLMAWKKLHTQQELNMANAKIEEMVIDGKTDGEGFPKNYGDPNNPPVPPFIVTRTWTTEADALEWRTFCETYFSDAFESCEITVQS